MIHAIPGRCPASAGAGPLSGFLGPHPAEHVADIGLNEAPDSAIWDHAVDNSLILLTKDQDFPLRRQQAADGPVIVWIRIGNTSRRALLRWIESLVNAGDTLIEIR